MNRRDVLRTGAAGGLLGLAGAGCGAAIDGPAAASVPDLSALGMDEFLARLDTSLGFLRSSSTLDELVSPSVLASARNDPRFGGADGLVRSSFRSLLLVGSFGDLPDAGRAHPGVQARMWNSMPEMDGAVRGMHAMLTQLTPGERAGVTRALRDDPGLGARVLTAIDAEAERAGIDQKRRTHLARFGERVIFRMRHSMNGLTDDIDATVKKVSALDGSIEESERRLMAALGPRGFQDEHARYSALSEAWDRVPALAQVIPPGPSAVPAPSLVPTAPLIPPQPASAPPGQPLTSTGKPVYVYLEPESRPPPRGTWTLRAGGILLGMAALRASTGLLLLLLGGGVSGIGVLGMFDLTQGAVLLVAGIITLIIGAVQRS